MLSLLVLTQRWIVQGTPVSPSRLAVLLVGAAAFLLPPSAARADIHTTKQKGKLPRGLVEHSPASPVPTTEEIDPGGQVEITLEAHGGGAKAIEFDFASQPEHGVLTGFHLLARNKAVVTYAHDAASGPGHDEFTYRVQGSGLEVSGPAKVEITIHDYPPILNATPAEVDFGTVKAGEVSRAQVTLRNDGGGMAAGHLDVPQPWDVEGEANYRIGPGEKQTFRLVFKPENGRGFSETVHVGGYGNGPQRNGLLHLFGTGLGGPEERQFAGINGVPPVPVENPADAPQPTAIHPRAAAGMPVNARPAPGAAGSGSLAGAAGSSAATAGRTGTGPAASSSGGTENSAASGTEGGATFTPPEVILNTAGVKQLTAGPHGRTQMEIIWKEPQPRPAKYRVELRHLSKLSVENNDDLVVTWQAYAKVDYQVKNGVMSASLRDLPADTSQTARVIAIDSAGHFAAPSPQLEVKLDPALHWWRLSLVQYGLIALAVCLFFVIRKRLQDRGILAQLEVDRAMRRRAEA